MDGLAVIREGDSPILLIDAPRSMMKDLYDMQQVFVREYEFPVNM